MGAEESVWDEGGKTRYRSCYKPFPLNCVFAAEAIMALRKAAEGATRNQSSTQLENDPASSFQWERFAVGV